jgi:hypothetical protein
MFNIILAALGLAFALVVGWLLLNSPNPEALAVVIVGVIIAGVGAYYLWLNSDLDRVPAAMRTYPWATSERGLLVGGIVLIVVAAVLIVLGAVVMR